MRRVLASISNDELLIARYEREREREIHFFFNLFNDRILVTPWESLAFYIRHELYAYLLLFTCSRVIRNIHYDYYTCLIKTGKKAPRKNERDYSIKGGENNLR